MRGESHLSISVGMSIPTWYILYKFDPLSPQANVFLVIIIGIAVGSLLPDIDASDAKVMHGSWSPIGRFTKKFFYKPLTKTDILEDKHRGFLHSLLGCLLISAFFVPIVVALSVIIWFLNPLMYVLSWLLWWFWIGIPIGFLLHLAEDSFTKSGVRWFYPRGEPTLSTTRTHRGSEYLLVMVFWAVAAILIEIVWFLPSSVIAILSTLGVTLVLFVFLHRINPRISKLGDKLFLRAMVEELIVKRGGIKHDYRRPGIPNVSIEGDGKVPKFYIARITDMGGQYGLVSDVIFWDIGSIQASEMKNRELIEVRTFEDGDEKRLYYVVRNGYFCLFADQLIELLRN
ncbi:MAG: metal-dependent hydrolase [Candidatus Thorarchaeota archaeon]